MSDVMFYGVLQMPYEMAMGDELSRRQFYGRVQEAIDRLKKAEVDAKRYQWLRAQHWNDNTLCVVARPKEAVKLGFSCPSGELLDDAIAIRAPA